MPESHSFGSLVQSELYTGGFVHLVLLSPSLATASHHRLYDGPRVHTTAQVLG